MFRLCRKAIIRSKITKYRREEKKRFLYRTLLLTLIVLVMYVVKKLSVFIKRVRVPCWCVLLDLVTSVPNSVEPQYFRRTLPWPNCSRNRLMRWNIHHLHKGQVLMTLVHVI